MQHSTKHDGMRWLLALALMLAPAAAHAQNNFGQDSRYPSALGGYEGSQLSTEFHGARGFWAYPGHFFEGSGLRNDHGHSGEVREYGPHADASGHDVAGYRVQRLFIAGEYNDPDMRLFHYRSGCRGEH